MRRVCDFSETALSGRSWSMNTDLEARGTAGGRLRECDWGKTMKKMLLAAAGLIGAGGGSGTRCRLRRAGLTPRPRADGCRDLRLEWLLHRPQRRRRIEPQLLDTTRCRATIPTAAEGCHDATGGLVGGQIGYRWQIGSWVFGLEAQGDWADLKGSNASLSLIPATPTRPRSTLSACSPARPAMPGTTCSGT